MNDPFADELTRAVYHGLRSGRARALPRRLQRIARRRMDMVQSAMTLADLRSAPASSSLEALSSGLDAPFSMAVHGAWRLLFHWRGPGDSGIGLTREDPAS